MSTPAVDYFATIVRQARAEARNVSKVYRAYEPAVRVGLTVIGPDNVHRVPCGEATFPRCQADVFADGVLTITNRDDESVVREYRPEQWTEAICYGYHGDIDYVLTSSTK